MVELSKPTGSLAEMDANVRKRKAGDINGDHVEKTKNTIVDMFKNATSPQKKQQRERASTPPPRAREPSSSPLSSPGSMSDAESSRDSPSPNLTPADRSPLTKSQQKSSDDVEMTNATTIPASSTTNSSASKLKRKRLTPAERKAQEEEKKQKQLEKDQKKKDAEEKKAKVDAEKEQKRIEKEQKKKEADEKKAKLDAEKQIKAQEREAKRLKKEEDERKVKEEKEKKERSQMRLNTFFKMGPPATPKKPLFKNNNSDKSDSAAAIGSTSVKDDDEKAASPDKKPAPQAATSQYEKLFKPFFVKSSTQMAVDPFALDDETKEAKSRILDEYIAGQRPEIDITKFDPVESLNLISRPPARGRLHTPVKQTVEEFHSLMEMAQKKGNIEEQSNIQRETRERLAKVPIKVLYFQQDVRPPYRGTVTLKPHAMGLQRMRKLARNPTGRHVPVDYDYDSEAEWQDDDGEDLDLDDEEDIDDLEDGDECANLIDDSEAVELTRFGANGLEPQSSGICWEGDNSNKAALDSMKPFRMEFIIGDRIVQQRGIDPFSTAYWEPDSVATKKQPKTTKGGAADSVAKKGGNSTITACLGINSTNTADCDKANSKKAIAEAGASGELPDGLSDKDLLKVKKFLKSSFENLPDLSKAVMAEVLRSSVLGGVKLHGKEIPKNDAKTLAKTMLDVMTVRKKLKGGDISWSLKPEYEIASTVKEEKGD